MGGGERALGGKAWKKIMPLLVLLKTGTRRSVQVRVEVKRTVRHIAINIIVHPFIPLISP